MQEELFVLTQQIQCRSAFVPSECEFLKPDTRDVALTSVL